MDTIRFGICGTGGFGRTRAKALHSMSGGQVTLGWSRTQKTRDTFSRELDAPTVEHWQALCESPEVDAVLVSSTDVEHFPHARAALEAGKHVLVEIPLSMNATQAKELAQLAADRSLVVHHGLQWRHHPDHLEHIEKIRSVGPLLHGIEHFYWRFGPDRRWMLDPAFNAGARDFLAFFMPRWMEAFGDVQRVTGVETRTSTFVVAGITMEFAAGGYVTVSYSMGEDIFSEMILLIAGLNGMINLNDGGDQILTNADGEHSAKSRPADELLCECEVFRDEILGKRDYRPPLEYDLRALELVDEALPSPLA